MKVAVAGGTGLMGGLVVARLRDAGHEVAVLARGRGVDLVSGRGLPGALDGCEAVVDVTNVITMGAQASREFFGTVTGHLLRAGREAGVRHLVALSIVGIDRVPLGYYQGKVRQEELVEAGPLPWTVLRATQFHEFAGQILPRVSRGPLALVPVMRCRPVAAAEVADHLVELATGAPAGRLEIAGPEVIGLPDMVRRLLRARGARRLVVPLRTPGGAAAAHGGLLPQGEYRRGVQTFEEYLHEHEAAPARTGGTRTGGRAAPGGRG